ncbi:MAG: cysteine desulfurase [Patescibacteria group bacterium]|nr:cysteine desulfurase [Patescibacteria group bacterium]
MKRIYMDYSATTPVKKEVLKAMLPYLQADFGNPSSIHSFGRKARQAVERARKQMAKFLNCTPEEIIFTSGGTEANNLAIRGIIKCLGASFVLDHPSQPIPSQCSVNRHFTQDASSIFFPHIITSEFEHHAVLHTCQDLEKQGLADVTYIKPNAQGVINVQSVINAIRPNTILISIMYVNNEIGTIQPIAEIGKVVRRLTLDASKKTNDYCLKSRVYFHTDAVQAVEYQDCDVKKLGVDMLSLSAHKIGGPKGVGVLYIKKGTPISVILTGGAQEFKKRAGTENVPGIVGLGQATEIISHKPKVLSHKLLKLRDYFITQVQKNIPDVILNGSLKKRSPNNINFSFKYIEGESILLNLDLLGIAASSGSACTSGSLSPSHVLLSLGLKEEDAHGSVRFTIGEKTTKEEIDYVVKNLIKIVRKLRAMSPFSN